MVKIRKYANGIERFLHGEKGQRFFNFAYSIGAAIVIWGALFKILHLPGGSTLLCVGMGTEIAMFILTAFDRPPKEYHWEDVFPVLDSHNPEDRPNLAGGGGGNFGGVVINGTPVATGGSSEPVEYDGVNHQPAIIDGEGAGETDGPALSGGISGGGVIIAGGGGVIGGGTGVAGGSSVGGTVVAGGGVIGGTSVGGILPPGTEISEEEAESLRDAIKKMTEAGEQMARMGELAEVTSQYVEQMSAIAQQMSALQQTTQALNEASSTLLSAYRAVTDNQGAISDNAAGYVDQMADLNRNIGGLNTIYEIQLKSVSSQLESIDRVNRGLKDIRDMYEKSAAESSRYCEETEKMARYMKQLNSVYEKMIHAMTINMYNPMMGGAPQAPANPFAPTSDEAQS